jgi:ribonucleoside-diphosphate reductase alpha chain
MKVLKRSGATEDVRLDKLTFRVKSLSEGLKVDPVSVAQKTAMYLKDGITTREIDRLLAETAAGQTTEHPDYSRVAGRIIASSVQKETGSFYEAMKAMYKAGMLSESFITLVRLHGKKLEQMIDYERDFNFDYFGIVTLADKYLTQVDDQVVERPQHLFMRVALSICQSNLHDVRELYNLMSEGYYTHATPTLFNAGLKNQQMSSCYLVAMESDSIEGIYNTLKECALISKYAGGIGVHIHNIRASDAIIKSTGRKGDGLVPMLKVFNDTARYVNQGGKRKGSIAMYLEPWHADVEDFLDLRKQQGPEERRAHDLFTAMWVSDLFMNRVKENADWTLFSPDEAPGLADVYGEEFETLYKRYETEGRGRRTIKAQDLMVKIVESQIEHGVPYIGFKDHANRKSNQKNIGVIKSSNLCIEIMEVSTPEETAVCNLASICLPKFVNVETKSFDYKKLGDVVSVAIKNLNRVIDLNFYPTEKTHKSNSAHRPVGLGVQGLHDVFMALGLPFDSAEAREINRNISETMYFHAVQASADIAEKEGPYSTYQGSPMSKGVFQFDMWDTAPSSRYDWAKLKEKVLKVGVRNSLLIALMPTASTAQIFGNTESFEPMTSNLYKRQVLAGEFVVLNRYLIAALEARGLWNTQMRLTLLSTSGSVQNVPEIPDDLKAIFRTVWEISQKSCIEMAADRAAFVCQSQSMNLYIADANVGKINSALFYAWQKGLKTGSYYLRSRSRREAVSVTTEIPKSQASSAEALVCSIENPEDCEACGS